MLDKVRHAVATALDAVVGTVGVRIGEEPASEPQGRAGEAEIRRYASRMVIETVVPGEEEAARSEGFSRLAGYIFGANGGSARIAMTAPVAQEPMRIAMTAPVATQAAAEGWRIRFFLPAALRDPPAPKDTRVVVAELPAETFAVLRFSGLPSPAALAAARARLLAALAGSGWQQAGEPVSWLYDPPWTVPALRRNEVAVPVTRRAG